MIKCGLIGIVGRPNVGKSTLLNQILDQKISITSRKPQTTRYQILGIRSEDAEQMIFVDTPGWQHAPKNRMNRLMNRQVKQALSEVDFIIMMADCRGWVKEDEDVAKMVLASGVPAMMLLNKQDLIKDKKELLPLIASFTEKDYAFSEFVPFCARTGKGIGVVLEQACRYLPERPFIFPKDQVTDRPERFLAAEIIREKIMHFLGDEIPYTTSVVIDDFEELEDITNILATVWVERESQKPIVIGKKGSLLKRIASDARVDIEKMLQNKVFLKIWVKTKKGWLDNSDALKTIGMTD